MEHGGEAARRVGADDRPRVDALPAQRVGLQFRVLDHRSPEGPGIGDDDAHLHATEDMDVTLEDALRLAAESEPVPGLVLAVEGHAARRAADPLPGPGASVAQERKLRGGVELQKPDGNPT